VEDLLNELGDPCLVESFRGERGRAPSVSLRKRRAIGIAGLRGRAREVADGLAARLARQLQGRPEAGNRKEDAAGLRVVVAFEDGGAVVDARELQVRAFGGERQAAVAI